MKRPLIAPSILAADFSRLGEEVRAVEKAGADVLHIDIMDGHFVPNLTMGSALVKSLRPHTKLPFDCHLMVENPEVMIGPFAKAGADWISVHVEACDLSLLLPKIKAMGCKAGVALNPSTPLERILPFVALADFILVMTVNPGFSGQTMISECLDKVRELAKIRATQRLSFQIEVDGGVTTSNAKEVIAAGADIVVAGAGLFHTRDYRETLKLLRLGSDPGV